MNEKGYLAKLAQNFRFSGEKKPSLKKENDESKEVNKDGQVMVELNLVASRCAGKTIADVEKTFKKMRAYLDSVSVESHDFRVENNPTIYGLKQLGDINLSASDDGLNFSFHVQATGPENARDYTIISSDSGVFE